MEAEAMNPEEQLRNPMTTRWADADFKLVSDTAWRMRLSTSELVRRLVLAGLRGQPGGKAAGKAAAAGNPGRPGDPN